MKVKKFLAVILSVAIVATSGNFTLDVHASGDGDDKPAVIAEEVDSGQDNDASRGIDGDGADTVSGGDSQEAESGTHGGDELIIDENEYFAVSESGKLREKPGLPISSLSGTVKLPASAKKIPKGIFNGNTKITGLEIPADSQLTEIEAGAFEGSGVASLALPDAVTEIADATFKDSKLATITFSANSNLTTIGKEAFAGSSLKMIAIPGQVKKIGNYAFRSCTYLASVSMGSVEVIGAGAFKSCTALQKSITWSKSLKEIGDEAFAGSGLTALDLSGDVGAGITTWGIDVFAGCKSLTTVNLHASMETIPSGMFRDCVKLSPLKFPTNFNCRKIEKEAFYGCNALKSVTIPAKVEAIEKDAFGGCQNLTTIVINQRSNDDSGESDIKLADDAFPRKSGITMKGYDGTVREYADKYGYTFVSLFTANKIKVAVNHTSWGTVNVSPDKAKPGETVTVTVTPNPTYRLKASTFRYYLTDNKDEETYITKLVEEKKSNITTDTGTGTTTTTAETITQVFSFVMPEDAVTVHVDFMAKSNGYGTISTSYIDFETVGDIAPYWDSKAKPATLTFDRVGVAARLVISSSKPEYAPGAWEFNYKSNNSKVAVIDKEGVIYACGVGTATITATLRADTDKEVSFRVKVDGDSLIDHLDLVFTDLGKAKVTTEVIDGEEMTIVQYTKDSVLKRSRDFKVNLIATSGSDSANLFVSSQWKSANDALAYPEEETVWNNENIIHVQEGASGETAITIKATNGQTDKDKKVEYCETTFIVRVIDATPRLSQSTLTVNALSTEGTEFELISVYGYEVDPASLQIIEDVKNGKVTEYEKNSYVVVVNKNGKLYLELTQEGRSVLVERGKDITYSNKTYIEGEYVYLSDGVLTRDTFRTPIKSLVLTAKPLKPSIKLNGKLNLFFNSLADPDDIGRVTVTQSLRDINVMKYELVSEANYNNAHSEAIDSLANNFDISDDGVITRSANELKTDAKGKPVTKGYLKITYEGYEPCYVKITIPVQTKKPNYVLSMTKATVNTYSTGYELKLQVLDKKTKKVIPLANLASLSFDESGAGLTESLFESLNAETARESDTITLKIKNPQKSKVMINVEMNNWNEPMKFTFNLSVSSKTPTIKAKKSTLTLNNLCVGRETTTAITVSQQDVELSDIDVLFAGKAALEYDAAAIDLSLENGELVARAGNTLQKGSYKFKVTPTFTYMNGERETGKAITVTVKVTESKLTMSMKKKTLTLNNIFAGTEEAGTTYTIKNLPVSNKVNPVYGGTIQGANATSEAVQQCFDIIYGADEQTIAVKQTAKVHRAATYKFKVSGLKTLVEGNEVEIQPFTVSIKVIQKAPKLTLKTSGSLNPCNTTSQVVYKFAVSNVNARITNVKVNELDKLNAPIAVPEDALSGELRDLVWEPVYNEAGYITEIIVRTKEGVTLNSKEKYKLKMGITLEGYENEVWSSAVTVKFKQTLPKVKTDVDTAILYAGVAADSPKRSQELLITKTSEKDAVIREVVLASSNSDNLKKAFTVSFDPLTQKAKVTLVRPYLVKANTQYNLKLEVKAEGQMENTKGTIFTLKVKVMN